MPQFSIPPGGCVGVMVTLSPADSKHLSRVLRARVGDKIRLFDGTSRFEAELTSLSPRQATAKIRSLLVVPRLQGDVTLCQALLKRDKMEWIIQKGVELGLRRLIPFVSSRAIPREAVDVKHSRWKKIADEALKQCGRVDPLVIAPLTDLRTIVGETKETSHCLFFSDGGNRPSELLRGPKGEPWTYVIGPEGGFTEEERTLVRKRQIPLASLGSLTLRAETAAIAALTLIQHELGNM